MTTNQNLRIYEAIAHEAAIAAAQRRELTPAEREASTRIYDAMRDVAARAERAIRGSNRVRASILAMPIEAVVLRLAELFDSRPNAVFAHRNLKSLTENDLRTALEDLETMIERET